MDDPVELTDDRPTVDVTGRGLCPECNTEVLWRATVTREVLGVVYYWSACPTCLEETDHTVDLRAGSVRLWDPGV
jgi:hypothetical protein